MTELERFLHAKADELAPIDPEWPDCRSFDMSESPDALSGNWLNKRTSYIWRVGVLAQWDSNKCDYARIFVGHERAPGKLEFIGMLYYQDGENDDIGRSLQRIVNIAGNIHPAFMKPERDV